MYHGNPHRIYQSSNGELNCSVDEAMDFRDVPDSEIIDLKLTR